MQQDSMLLHQQGNVEAESGEGGGAAAMGQWTSAPVTGYCSSAANLQQGSFTGSRTMSQTFLCNS